MFKPMKVRKDPRKPKYTYHLDREMFDSTNECHQIYVLFRNDLPTYVGVTLNLYGRLRNHLNDGRDFNAYAVIFQIYNKDTAYAIEKAVMSCIQMFNPNIENIYKSDSSPVIVHIPIKRNNASIEPFSVSEKHFPTRSSKTIKTGPSQDFELPEIFRILSSTDFSLKEPANCAYEETA